MNKFTKMLAIAATPAVWPALFRGVAATMEHGRSLQGFSFANVVDVGANKGQFAAFAAATWPDANIFCFEPLPAPRARLASVLAAVAPRRSTLFDCALGAMASTTVIHVASREDSSSLLPLADEQKRLFGMTSAGELEVRVQRLDETPGMAALENALLKIDVQGYELEVLKGGAGILRDFKAIYVEMSFVELYQGQALANEVVDFLTEFGFSQVGAFNAYFDESGRIVQADALFVQSES